MSNKDGRMHDSCLHWHCLVTKSLSSIATEPWLTSLHSKYLFVLLLVQIIFRLFGPNSQRRFVDKPPFVFVSPA